MRWNGFLGQFKSLIVLLLFVFLATGCERFVGSSISEKDAATPTNERQSFTQEEFPERVEQGKEKSQNQNEKEENEKCAKVKEDPNLDLDETDCLNSPNNEEKSSIKLSDQ